MEDEFEFIDPNPGIAPAGISYEENRTNVLAYLNDKPEEFAKQIQFYWYDPLICCFLTETQCPPKINFKKRLLGPAGKIGIPYLLEYEDADADAEHPATVLKITQNVKPNARYLTNPITNLDLILPSLGKCLFPVQIQNYHFLACDEFSNETLIAYILDYIFRLYGYSDLNINFYVKHISASICYLQENQIVRLVGVNWMEYCDLGTLDDFLSTKQPNDYDSTLIQQILKQIVIGLSIMQQRVQFIHGDLKSANVFLKSDPINLTYDSIVLQAPFTCKIADYGKSSLGVFTESQIPLRIFNENVLATRYLQLVPFSPDIITEGSQEYYLIRSFSEYTNAQLYSRSRHMGIPYYFSFDLYTVLISILLYPNVYFGFFNDAWMQKHVWSIMFDLVDGNTVKNRIYDRMMFLLDQKQKQSYTDSVNILRNIRLKCNLVSLLYEQMKN